MSVGSYIPPEWVRPVCAADVERALVLPCDPYGQPLLVLSRADDWIGCFLGDDFTFEAANRDQARQFHGLALEEFEIELALDAVTSREGAAPGCFVRSSDRLEFLFKGPRGTYPATRRICVADGLSVASGRSEAFFPKWQLVRRLGFERIALWSAGAKVEASNE